MWTSGVFQEVGNRKRRRNGDRRQRGFHSAERAVAETAVGCLPNKSLEGF